MKVAIVGGSGKMGQWFARFLLEEGNQVTIIGRDESKLLGVQQQLKVDIATDIKAVGQADVILISVPIDAFEQVVEQIAAYTGSGQVITDVTSVKTLPMEAMHKHIKAGVVLGTHPVFGPGARSLTNQNFVLTPINEKETALAQKAKQYLEERGARATLMTPEEHDEMMAVVLGLSHFIAIATADSLLSLDKFKQMKGISGTTYKVLLTLVESVVSEDPELYASLQMSLPKMAETEELFQRSSKTWADLVRNQNRQEFIKRMNTLKSKLEEVDPEFGRAYDNMYQLIEGL
jgi:prephenate dehydrogenase